MIVHQRIDAIKLGSLLMLPRACHQQGYTYYNIEDLLHVISYAVLVAKIRKFSLKRAIL
jgi:hypothetical protein